jgi:hypothetical protein
VMCRRRSLSAWSLKYYIIKGQAVRSARPLKLLNTSFAYQCLTTTTTIQEALQSFTPFPRLPRELQIKIWKCSLEPPRVVPRIVRVEYSLATDSFAYTFPIPPALEVCHLSREVALKLYLPLVPGSASPVYFNPNVDFLYCKSPFDPVNPSATPLPPTRPILPFVDPQTDVSAIRFLVLDHEFWTHRVVTNHTCPIKELRDFRSIHEIFLIVPSLGQWRERKKALFSLFPHQPDDPRFDLDRRYAEELARDASAPSAIVPGFRLYPGRGGPLHEREVLLCFGWRDHPLDPQNPFRPPVTFYFDEYWVTRKLPKLSEIRVVED